MVFKNLKNIRREWPNMNCNGRQWPDHRRIYHSKVFGLFSPHLWGATIGLCMAFIRHFSGVPLSAALTGD